METRDRVAALPHALQPTFVTEEPNQDIPLYSGSFDVYGADVRLAFEGTVTFRWLPRPATVIEGHSATRSNRDLEDVRVAIPNQKSKTRLLVLGCVRSMDQTKLTAWPRGHLRLGREAAVESVKFHLTNFHAIRGHAVKAQSADGLKWGAWRTSLQSERWVVTLDEVPGYAQLEAAVHRRGGYAISHVGEFRRTSGRAISVTSAEMAVSGLQLYFGFVRGLWCGPFLTSGHNAGAAHWWEWTPRNLTAWHSVSSWLDEPFHNGNQLFPGFMAKFESSVWSPALRLAIFWYLEANANSGLETAIVLSQSALELLAWALLVEESPRYSSTAFGRLSAEERVRALLTTLSIPVRLPAYARGLRRLGSVDGPDSLVTIRNALVHFRRAKHSVLDRTPTDVRLEAVQLSLQYLELAILAICGYEGMYRDRFRVLVGVGLPSVRKVPWI
jgi:hypothetical protein